MQFGIRSLSALALGLALTCTVANAQLLLSGHTTGSFDDLAEANTTVMNSADGSWATFETGIPVMGSTESKIEFTNVERTRASARVTIGYEGGTVELEKEGSTWIAKRLTNRWIT